MVIMVAQFNEFPVNLGWANNLLVSGLGLSFVFLGGAAVELWVSSGQGAHRASRRGWIAGFVLVWLCLTLLRVGIDHVPSPLLETTEGLLRYSLGLTGSLFMAGVLWSITSLRDPESGHTLALNRWLRRASVSLCAYGLFAGLVGPKAAFFPASVINAELFAAWFHFPVEVARASAALLVGWTLSQAFVVQLIIDHAEWERLREEFLAVVAHDFRSPLNVIQLSTELLRFRLAPDDSTSHKSIGLITNSAGRLSRMVADLVDESCIVAHRLSLSREELNLRDFLPQVLERTVDATDGHAVKLSLPDALPSASADPGRLVQILVNLLSNAAKYSTPGSEILIAASATATELTIAVTNQGTGISESDQGKLFNRFYRAPAASRSGVGGLGLGLYITKGLVEAHGGRISVTSQPGRSVTFQFTLPCAIQRNIENKPYPERLPIEKRA
jgi:signal transduction histidine kinase